MHQQQSHEPAELSYFGLSLQSYLKENHPFLADNAEFIAACADTAAEAYSQAVKDGLPHDRADEIAAAELYWGLIFSPFNTLVGILVHEFSQEIPEDRIRETAMHLYPLCANVLDKYALSDDFAGTPEYELLYTELTGTIQILLDNGL
ncbi:MAG: DUF1896 domain-containing protein [Tannerellaceae bacterium]|jgi:hypothetical protein|nr:DUF1896 domain-containing protein [Tannerellaceae bacterium]